MRPTMIALAVVASVVAQASLRSVDARQHAAPPCKPLDAAWAVQLRAVDATTRRPVAHAEIDDVGALRFVETDSAGWACIRTLTKSVDSLEIERRGYEPESVVVRGVPGTTVHREVPLRRVERPCCDLRGRWRITMDLDHPAAMAPKPKSRRVAGELALGPHELAPEAGDDLDSLVHVTRGLHQVDFTPFFGGPVAPDVSRSVFGSGPDLLHEVEASGVGGDRVIMRFIPRMSHGSISFRGRARGDTIRGRWVQNAYCCGAEGTFEMVRVGTVDTTSVAAPPPPAPRGTEPPDTVAPGEIPRSHWRPAFAVAPGGALWLASGGLFVTDSMGGSWRRVLGGNADPVEADELRIGVAVAPLDARSALVGLPRRYGTPGAPVLYRTGDAGAHWTAIALPGVAAVQALEARGSSVWLVAGGLAGQRTRILASDDSGITWRDLAAPEPMLDADHLFRWSADTAFVATSSRHGSPALWRTDDGGAHWVPTPTPHDQGLQHVADGYVRVVELARVGQRLVAKEFSDVFMREIDDPRWQRLPGIAHIASDAGGHRLFALTDELRPEILDSTFRPVWRAPTDIDRSMDREIEQVLMRDGSGYVSFGQGSILRAGPLDGIHWLGPQRATPPGGATIELRPPTSR